MVATLRSFRSIAAAMLVAVGGAVLGGCDALPPDAVRGPRKIVAGPDGTCALWDTAPMRCWGGTPYGASTMAEAAFARPGTRPDATDVTLGSSIGWSSGGGCVVDRLGALECTRAWVERRRVFPPLRSAPSMRDVHDPVIGEAHVCALARADGERDEAVWCHERVSVPFGEPFGVTPTVQEGWERLGLGDAISLASGAHRVCALVRSGGARCVELPSREVRDVEGITDAVQIVLGDDFGCARDARGGVRCFGEGADGQLGDGDPSAGTAARPVPLPGPATDLAAGYRRACAIVNGAPFCWGLLRRKVRLPAVVARTPQRVAELDDLQQLAVGGDFACATRKDGTVWCWGRDGDGALGDGSLLPSEDCSRAGSRAGGPEGELPRGPTAVRTGDAGPHPQWRLPLAIAVALLVLVPLGWSLAVARAAIRRKARASLAERIAVYGSGILAALLAPIALARALPGALAAASFTDLRFQLWWFVHDAGHPHGALTLDFHSVTREATWVGRVALATLGPAFALGVATASFIRLCRARRDLPATVARRGGAWLVAAAILLSVAMMVTPDVNERAREELVFLARDARIDLSCFFAIRSWASLAWIALVAGYALFTVSWSRAGGARIPGSPGRMRPKPPAGH